MNQNFQNPNFMPPQPPMGGPVNDGKSLSIAALVCGILGIVGGWIPFLCYFTLVLAIIGIVLGVKGRAQSTLAYGKASGLATAGLILGIVGTVLGALFTLCTTCVCVCPTCALCGSASGLAGLADLYY